MKYFIEQIYSKTISEVLKDIPDKYEEEIKKSYKNCLNEKYYNVDFDIENIDEILDRLVKLEVSLYKNMNYMTKLSYLIKDMAFEKIGFISNLGYENAQKRIKQNIIMNELEANSYIKLMNEQLHFVKEFNIMLAKNYISEGTVDFLYACGTSNDTSLRLGRQL